MTRPHVTRSCPACCSRSSAFTACRPASRSGSKRCSERASPRRGPGAYNEARPREVERMLGEVITAIVTPFREDGSVDLTAFGRLCAHLVDNGSDGLVVAGTTGEAPTLSDREKLELFAAAVDAVGDRATIIAGTGGNDTAHSVELTREADALEVDGFLVVTPYYNKPPPRGI